MKQLTVRGFSVELQQALYSIAHQKNISLNKAALYLMNQGAGLQQGQDGSAKIGHRLDRYIGTWSENEQLHVQEAVAELDAVTDSDFWS